MRTQKIFRTITALTLSLCMLLSGCISAFAADRTEPMHIRNGVDTQTGEVTTIIDGNIDVDNTGNWYGPALRVDEDDDDEDDDEKLEVTGDVEIVRDNDSATGVTVTNSTDDGLTVTIDKNVSAATNGDYYYANGLQVVGNGEGGETAVEVKGDVSASIESDTAYWSQTTAVSAESERGSSVSVTVGGNVQASTNTDKDNAASAVVIGVTATADGDKSETTIKVTGDIGGYINAAAEGTDAKTEVNGGKDAEGGIYAHSSNGGYAKVEIQGNEKNETNAQWYEATAVSVLAGDSETEVKIGGDLSVKNTNENNGEATAISVQAAGEGSKATVTVAGDVSSETAAEYHDSNGIVSNNKGGTINIDVAGNVHTEATGISVRAEADRRDRWSDDETDFAAFKANAKLTETYDNGSKQFSFEGDNGISGYYYIDPDGAFDGGWIITTKENAGKTNITIGGNVEGDISAQTAVQHNDIDIKVGGSVDGGVSASSTEDSSAKVNIKGKVNNEAETQWSAVYGVNASTNDGVTEVSIGGDVSARNNHTEDGGAAAVSVQTTGEDSKLTVTIAGDATSNTASEDYGSTGISSRNRGGSVNVNIAGDVVTEGTGINAKSEAKTTETYLSKEEDIKDYKDKAKLVSTYTDGRKQYSFTDDNGISVYYYINADGSFNHGWKTVTEENKGSTNITVGGSVDGTVSASSNVKDNDIDISIGGNVKGSVNAASNREENDTSIKVGGSVDGGVSAFSTEDSSTKVDIKGKVDSESDSQWSTVYGVNASTSNGVTEVSIGGDVSAKNNHTEDGGAVAVSVQTTGEDSKMTVTIAGDATSGTASEDYGSTGISSRNRGGSVNVNIAGDVVTEGTGINASSEAKTTETYLSKEEDIKDYKDKAKLVSTYTDGRKEYSFTDDNGISGYYYINADGSFDYGWKTVTKDNKGSTNITVGGSVDGTVRAESNAKDNDIDISIGGNVKGSVNAASNKENSDTNIDIGGNVEGSIRASSGGKDSSSTVSVDGDVAFENKTNGTIYAVTASASDGSTTVDIQGDVSVNNTGTKNSNSTGVRVTTTGEDSKASVHIGGDVSAQSESGTRANVGIGTVNSGGNIEVDVDGSVFTAGNGISAGTEKTTKSEKLTEADIAQFRDKARVSTQYSDGRIRYSYSEGDVTYSFTLDSEGNYLNGNKQTIIENIGSTEINVKGDVTATAPNEKNTFYGITASSNQESQDVQVSVGGNVSATGSNHATGTYVNNQAGSVAVTIDGNLESSGTGVRVRDDSSETYYKMSEEEIASMQDNFQLTDEWEYEDEEGKQHSGQHYKYVDENGNEYYYSIEDGEIVSSQATIRNDKTADNTVIVNGDINSNRTGINVSHDNRKGNESISIGGDINVTGMDNNWSYGVTTNGYNGTLDLTVEGAINVNSDNGGVTGLNAYVEGGEENIQIGGGVSVTGRPLNETHVEEDEDGQYEWTETDDIEAVQATVCGADSKLTISIADDVTATALSDPEMTTAIKIFNYSEDNALGELMLNMTGDVNSTGTGLYVDSGNRERKYLDGKAEIKEEEFYKTRSYASEDGEITNEKIYYNAEGDYYYNEEGDMWQEIQQESGETNVTIAGDVHGDDIGVSLWNVDNTNILIDGTVSGNNSAVLVSNEIIADSLNLTIWEIKPDDEGHYIEKQIGEDEDGNPITVEDEYMLDKIQYIIRVEPTQASMIRLLGTTEQDGYQVAHEGDTVVVKLNIPNGYMLNGVFGDVPKECKLLKDGNGDYFLVVPRGGGVFISLDLQRIYVGKKTVKATFYPNGGTVEGKDSPFTIEVVKDTEITLPQPDEREGYTFAGWYAGNNGPDTTNWKEPDANDPGLLQGGTQYKMEKNTCFTAIWKKAE